MDQQSFDRMARALGSAVSRRSGVRAALGAAFALAAARSDAATRAKPRREARHPKPEGPCGDGTKQDNACTRDKQCCTGYCEKDVASKDGKGRCRCIRRGSPCKPSQTCCGGTVCDGGVCQRPPKPVPTGHACDPAESVCADAAASCRAYAEHDPEGDYCLLRNGTACTASSACASGNCRSGLCQGFACDVCASGCPFSDLDLALQAAASGAVIRVAAGNWRTTSTGGTIADGYDLTVRACNGDSGVNVTSSDFATFNMSERASAGSTWTLQGLSIRNDGGFNGAFAIGLLGSPSTLNMARCRVEPTAQAQRPETGVWADANVAATISDCTITGAAGRGAFVSGGGPGYITTATLTRTAIEQTATGGASNGMSTALQIDGAEVMLDDCTISGNKSHVAGQGAAVTMVTGEFEDASTLTLAGATVISGNSGMVTGASGAVGVPAGFHRATVTIGGEASVTGNTAANGSAVIYQTGGLGSFTLNGPARISGNTGQQCVDTPDLATFTAVPGCVY